MAKSVVASHRYIAHRWKRGCCRSEIVDGTARPCSPTVCLASPPRTPRSLLARLQVRNLCEMFVPGAVLYMQQMLVTLDAPSVFLDVIRDRSKETGSSCIGVGIASGTHFHTSTLTEDIDATCNRANVNKQACD